MRVPLGARSRPPHGVVSSGWGSSAVSGSESPSCTGCSRLSPPLMLVSGAGVAALDLCIPMSLRLCFSEAMNLPFASVGCGVTPCALAHCIKKASNGPSSGSYSTMAWVAHTTHVPHACESFCGVCFRSTIAWFGYVSFKASSVAALNCLCNPRLSNIHNVPPCSLPVPKISLKCPSPTNGAIVFPPWNARRLPLAAALRFEYTLMLLTVPNWYRPQWSGIPVCSQIAFVTSPSPSHSVSVPALCSAAPPRSASGGPPPYIWHARVSRAPGRWSILDLSYLGLAAASLRCLRLCPVLVHCLLPPRRSSSSSFHPSSLCCSGLCLSCFPSCAVTTLCVASAFFSR